MADFSRLIDGLIEPFAPRLARRRYAERMALREIRQYDAAAAGRRTQGWRRTGASANREVRQGLVQLRNGARELVRNNKYAASAVRQIVANMVGDGITATAKHADPVIQQRAQDEYDRWAEGKVDDQLDWYGVQKMTARSVVEGGETLLSWGPDSDGPDGMVRGLEGDYLDHLKQTFSLGGPRIDQGVGFDANGVRAEYWLFDTHPGEIGGYGAASKAYSAANIDHVYEMLRWGQPRGISWFAPVAMDLRDGADVEDAVRMKKKVEACLALVLTPQEGGAGSPLAAQQGQDDPTRPAIETLRPGMVFRTRPGETVSTLNPTSTGGEVEFLRHQLMGVSANLAPYHLVSGDPSQSNYSQVRAQLLGFWANLDDWQHNMMLPLMCLPAFQRRMRRLAYQTGDKRFLRVKAEWAMPVRRLIDPIKDLAGEEIEIRGGLKSMLKALSERGINPERHIKEIAAFNELADAAGVVLDTDPRRVTDTGVLQAAVGYIAAKGDQTS